MSDCDTVWSDDLNVGNQWDDFTCTLVSKYWEDLQGNPYTLISGDYWELTETELL